MLPATRNDALRLLNGSSEVITRSVGAIPGVVVVQVSGRNGPGAGTLFASAGGLSWQAPGSSTPGAIVAIPSDATYMLEDGEDSSKWIRVQTYGDEGWLSQTAAGTIDIADSYNVYGIDDVSAANAASGHTETVTFNLKNVWSHTVQNVRMWLDPAVVDLTISSDGTNFFDPTSETDVHVLSWASIAAGSSVTVTVKRIIPASTGSFPSVLNFIQFSWQSLNL